MTAHIWVFYCSLLAYMLIFVLVPYCFITIAVILIIWTSSFLRISSFFPSGLLWLPGILSDSLYILGFSVKDCGYFDQNCIDPFGKMIIFTRIILLIHKHRAAFYFLGSQYFSSVSYNFHCRCLSPPSKIFCCL